MSARLSERTIAAALIRHIRESFGSEYNVDVEWDRHGTRQKTVDGKPIFADLLVHSRFSDRDNTLCVELKQPGKPVGGDKDRLRAMTNPRHLPLEERFGYQCGLFLKFMRTPSGRVYAKLDWFRDGAQDGDEEKLFAEHHVMEV
ncbi:MAG: hypothetical protein JRN20_21275 [Nitrososphaerota archaeon]|nr:hypothetical protein [Nitrososphaerota archaeon]